MTIIRRTIAKLLDKLMYQRLHQAIDDRLDTAIDIAIRERMPDLDRLVRAQLVAIDWADHIDYSELACNIDIDYYELGKNIDPDTGDLADELTRRLEFRVVTR